MFKQIVVILILVLCLQDNIGAIDNNKSILRQVQKIAEIYIKSKYINGEGRASGNLFFDSNSKVVTSIKKFSFSVKGVPFTMYNVSEEHFALGDIVRVTSCFSGFTLIFQVDHGEYYMNEKGNYTIAEEVLKNQNWDPLSNEAAEFIVRYVAVSYNYNYNKLSYSTTVTDSNKIFTISASNRRNVHTIMINIKSGEIVEVY